MLENCSELCLEVCLESVSCCSHSSVFSFDLEHAFLLLFVLAVMVVLIKHELVIYTEVDHIVILSVN
jgi:hypothetical protein